MACRMKNEEFAVFIMVHGSQKEGRIIFNPLVDSFINFNSVGNVVGNQF